MDEEFDDFLAHYGVKGMRWGVRKDRRATGTAGSAGTKKAKKATGHAVVQVKKTTSLKPVDENYKRARDRSTTKYLSNEELQARVTRLNLEAQYAKLRPKTTTERLLSQLGKTASTAAAGVASEIAKQYMQSLASQTVPGYNKKGAGSSKKK